MGKNAILLASLLLTTTFTSTKLFAGDFDLEMTGQEYAKYFNDNKDVGNRASAAVNNILNVGKRNLDWFKLINANRPADQQLPLYTPALQTGIPIESPKAYNEKTVTADYDNLIAVMPAAYKSVLLSNIVLPTNHPMATDDEYLEWARKMDRVYQSASRWTIMEPSLWALEARSYQDIRGYYFLQKVVGLEAQLRGWASLSAETQTQYSDWLVSLCHNSQIGTNTCRNSLNRSISNNKVFDYYTKYLSSGQRVFNAFFDIQGARRDVTWNASNPLLMSVPFTTPDNLEIKNWLADNVQDEWKWDGWQLLVNFVNNNSASTTHLVFEAGTTPHVNGLGGSVITMDENSPLQDYGTRWTIRHEYGHTLGFPDCYIEFYDSDKEVIINYQLDLDNIMCSRKGHIQEKHYLELKKNYFR